MSIPWSMQAWQTIRPVYDKILVHPFIIELIEGTLPKEKFEYYIQQDALYLAEFGKVLASIATKLEETADAQVFLQFALNTIAVEKALHQQYFALFETPKSIVASPTCLFYTNFMYACLQTKPLVVSLGSVLPCFWIYQQVGNYILAQQTQANNPYQEWINTYSGEEFGLAVQQAIQICDKIAAKCTLEQQAPMTDAFLAASKMEWLFWDSAYHLEKWKI